MAEITFLYKDKLGRISATSKASFRDEGGAIKAARLNLSEHDYHDVELWEGSRQIAKLFRRFEAFADAS